MHRLLHPVVEILDAERDPVEAEGAEDAQVVVGGDAGVDLDRHLGSDGEPEAARDGPEQPFALRRRQVGGRAAPPVELRERAAVAETVGDQCELGFDGVEVGGSGPCRGEITMLQPQ